MNKQHRARKNTLVIKLDDDEFDFLTSAKSVTGLPKQVAGRKALGEYFWNNHGLVMPGYKPDECPHCSFPVSEHTPMGATATEPYSLDCPILKDEDLPY